MTPNEYLEAVLQEQTLAPGSDELGALRERGGEVKGLLRSKFSQHSPSVRDAGSYKKKTMVRASYDYDALCYFPHDTDVGDNLKQIYDAVAEVLGREYVVERKRSALRLLDATGHGDPVYFHVDVVPGRFMTDDEDKVAIHQASGEKDWLQTNPEAHVDHVRDSRVRDAIKLAKVWRERAGFSLPTFVLELLVIDLLEGREDDDLPHQMVHVWKQLRDDIDSITVEDPANSNNDLSDLFDEAAQIIIAIAARTALERVQKGHWEAIFGEVEAKSKKEKGAALKGAAAAISKPSRPYFDGER